MLCDAHDKGIDFSVIVIDGRPKLEGREMLRRLVRHGIKCSYVLINVASYVMKEVQCTKSLLCIVHPCQYEDHAADNRIRDLCFTSKDVQVESSLKGVKIYRNRLTSSWTLPSPHFLYILRKYGIGFPSQCHHHHCVLSVFYRSAVMDLHRSRSSATLIQSLYDTNLALHNSEMYNTGEPHLSPPPRNKE